MTAGDIYTATGNGGDGGFSGDGGPATSAALNNPLSVTPDRMGNLLVADTNNDRVRMVAESSGTFYSQAMTKGDIYTIAGTGAYGESGDGGAPTSAKLSQPIAMGFDSAGNLGILDLGGRVRVVAP